MAEYVRYSTDRSNAVNGQQLHAGTVCTDSMISPRSSNALSASASEFVPGNPYLTSFQAPAPHSIPLPHGLLTQRPDAQPSRLAVHSTQHRGSASHRAGAFRQLASTPQWGPTGRRADRAQGDSMQQYAQQQGGYPTTSYSQHGYSHPAISSYHPNSSHPVHRHADEHHYASRQQYRQRRDQQHGYSSTARHDGRAQQQYEEGSNANSLYQHWVNGQPQDQWGYSHPHSRQRHAAQHAHSSHEGPRDRFYMRPLGSDQPQSSAKRSSAAQGCLRGTSAPTAQTAATAEEWPPNSAARAGVSTAAGRAACATGRMQSRDGTSVGQRGVQHVDSTVDADNRRHVQQDTLQQALSCTDVVGELRPQRSTPQDISGSAPEQQCVRHDMDHQCDAAQQQAQDRTNSALLPDQQLEQNSAEAAPHDRQSGQRKGPVAANKRQAHAGSARQPSLDRQSSCFARPQQSEEDQQVVDSTTSESKQPVAQQKRLSGSCRHHASHRGTAVGTSSCRAQQHPGSGPAAAPSPQTDPQQHHSAAHRTGQWQGPAHQQTGGSSQQDSTDVSLVHKAGQQGQPLEGPPTAGCTRGSTSSQGAAAMAASTAPQAPLTHGNKGPAEPKQVSTSPGARLTGLIRQTTTQSSSGLHTDRAGAGRGARDGERAPVQHRERRAYSQQGSMGTQGCLENIPASERSNAYGQRPSAHGTGVRQGPERQRCMPAHSAANVASPTAAGSCSHSGTSEPCAQRGGALEHANNKLPTAARHAGTGGNCERDTAPGAQQGQERPRCRESVHVTDRTLDNKDGESAVEPGGAGSSGVVMQGSLQVQGKPTSHDAAGSPGIQRRTGRTGRAVPKVRGQGRQERPQSQRSSSGNTGVAAAAGQSQVSEHCSAGAPAGSEKGPLQGFAGRSSQGTTGGPSGSAGVMRTLHRPLQGAQGSRIMHGSQPQGLQGSGTAYRRQDPQQGIQSPRQQSGLSVPSTEEQVSADPGVAVVTQTEALQPAAHVAGEGMGSVADATTSESAMSVEDGSEGEEIEADELCVICCEPMKDVALGACGHGIMCGRCCLRLRINYQDNKCPLCKLALQEVVIASWRPDLPSYAEFMALSKGLWHRASWCKGVFVERTTRRVHPRDAEGPGPQRDPSRLALSTQLQMLTARSCPVCDKRGFNPFPNAASLLRHMQVHRQRLCEVCVKEERQFTLELPVYRDSNALQEHLETHPRCDFCNKRYHGVDELYAHMAAQHFACQLCEQQGMQYQFFANAAELESHFRGNHFLCEEADCAGCLVAFATDGELRRHRIARHSSGMTRWNNSAARPLQLDFTSQWTNRGSLGRLRQRSENLRADISDDEEVGGNTERRRSGRRQNGPSSRPPANPQGPSPGPGTERWTMVDDDLGLLDEAFPPVTGLSGPPDASQDTRGPTGAPLGRPQQGPGARGTWVQGRPPLLPSADDDEQWPAPQQAARGPGTGVGGGTAEGGAEQRAGAHKKLVAVTVSCPCGRIKKREVVSEGEEPLTPSCDRECKTQQHRKRVAEAFEIGNPDTYISSFANTGNVEWPATLLLYAREHRDFVRKVEVELGVFVLDKKALKVELAAGMSSEQRKVVHEIVPYYKMVSGSNGGGASRRVTVNKAAGQGMQPRVPLSAAADRLTDAEVEQMRQQATGHAMRFTDVAAGVDVSRLLSEWDGQYTLEDRDDAGVTAVFNTEAAKQAVVSRYGGGVRGQFRLVHNNTGQSRPPLTARSSSSLAGPSAQGPAAPPGPAGLGGNMAAVASRTVTCSAAADSATASCVSRGAVPRWTTSASGGDGWQLSSRANGGKGKDILISSMVQLHADAAFEEGPPGDRCRSAGVPCGLSHSKEPIKQPLPKLPVVDDWEDAVMEEDKARAASASASDDGDAGAVHKQVTVVFKLLPAAVAASSCASALVHVQLAVAGMADEGEEQHRGQAVAQPVHSGPLLPPRERPSARLAQKAAEQQDEKDAEARSKHPQRLRGVSAAEPFAREGLLEVNLSDNMFAMLADDAVAVYGR